jgi:hypothetical protein
MSEHQTNPNASETSVDEQPPLAERAAIAARAELRGERTRILGATGRMALAPRGLRPRTVPERWSVIAVMERMEEAFRTLARLPIAVRPRGYINSMPFYLYDRGDLNAQMETQELERMTRLRNRVKELRRRADEDREIRDRWHAENRAAIATLTHKLDAHAAAVEMLRPAVAALEVSRSRLVALASLGFAGVVVFGWIVEAVVKWAAGRLLEHFQ